MKRSTCILFILTIVLALMLGSCNRSAADDPTATPPPAESQEEAVTPTETQTSDEETAEPDTAPPDTEESEETEEPTQETEKEADQEPTSDKEQKSAETDESQETKDATQETEETEEPSDQLEEADPPAAVEPQAGFTHTVRWGENLFRIGLRYGIDWQLLAQINNLADGAAIQAGQVLIIPLASAQTDSTLPRIHTVQAGENLYRIGLHYGLSWTAIAQANRLLNANDIYVGQELIIPGNLAEPESTAPAGGASSSTDTLTHMVQPGENLFRIGLQYNVAWNDIATANQLANANSIYAQQMLVIPSAVAEGQSSIALDKYAVGGHQLYLQCIGEGSPTVIFEAGLSDVSNTWDQVLPEVAQVTRACVYDRAGLGKSEPASKPRTSQQMADELYALLQAASEPGPYILVGHSLGGHNVRLFASQHNEVVGLVLVDSSHPDQNEQLAEVLPPAQADDSESLQAFRALVTMVPEDPSLNLEGWDIDASIDQVRDSGSLGKLPLIVITAGDKQRPADFPAELAQEIDQVWLELQRELAQLSSNSKHLIAQNSGHYIQQDQPDLVIQAILQILEESQG
jgi:pimeloyl-ACP methyl ester carboxylesterase